MTQGLHCHQHASRSNRLNPSLYLPLCRFIPPSAEPYKPSMSTNIRSHVETSFSQMFGLCCSSLFKRTRLIDACERLECFTPRVGRPTGSSSFFILCHCLSFIIITIHHHSVFLSSIAGCCLRSKTNVSTESSVINCWQEWHRTTTPTSQTSSQALVSRQKLRLSDFMFLRTKSTMAICWNCLGGYVDTGVCLNDNNNLAVHLCGRNMSIAHLCYDSNIFLRATPGRPVMSFFL